jgi:CTP:phosphocholine cytidylyltransferase-like protein
MGKMKKSTFSVLITTSGTGSRLKYLTQERNKGLIEIAGKPILGQVIETYPSDANFVITTGYKGDSVKDFIQSTYPDRTMTVVEIKKFAGPGSSLGYSMLQAREHLQTPFVFHCSDSLVKGTIPPPSKNWNGGSLGSSLPFQTTEFYSSFESNSGIMTRIKPKGAAKFDYFHIGLVGIHEYQKFWTELEQAYSENPDDSTLNDVISINRMIESGIQFEVVKFEDWFDTGNLDGLQNAMKKFT